MRLLVTVPAAVLTLREVLASTPAAAALTPMS
jgi:hypothetical protein